MGLRELAISPHLVLQHLKDPRPQSFVIEKGVLPADARLHNVEVMRYHPGSTVILTVESPTWGESPTARETFGVPMDWLPLRREEWRIQIRSLQAGDHDMMLAELLRCVDASGKDNAELLKVYAADMFHQAAQYKKLKEGSRALMEDARHRHDWRIHGPDQAVEGVPGDAERAGGGAASDGVPEAGAPRPPDRPDPGPKAGG